MRVASYNIRRGTAKKIEAIQCFLFEEKLDVLGIIEADIEKNETVPNVPGYVAHYDETSKKVRVVVYVREGLRTEKINEKVTIPAVSLHIGQVSITIAYNDFTSDNHRMTVAKRRE